MKQVYLRWFLAYLIGLFLVDPICVLNSANSSDERNSIWKSPICAFLSKQTYKFFKWGWVVVTLWMVRERERNQPQAS
jgi:hypothetical protein